jgi:hypothetical protein
MNPNPCVITKIPILRNVGRLIVSANVVPSSPILVTLMMEALCSYETSVLTRATRSNNPKGGILHSHYNENLISSILLILILFSPLIFHSILPSSISHLHLSLWASLYPFHLFPPFLLPPLPSSILINLPFSSFLSTPYHLRLSSSPLHFSSY